MSIRLMSQVWEKSKQKGSALLLLLALADWSNDEDGSCWAGVGRLAAKVRMSERNAQLLLRKLEAAGELRVEWNAGKQTSHGATNRYFVLVNKDGVKPLSPQGVKPLSPQGVKPLSPNTLEDTSVHTLERAPAVSSTVEGTPVVATVIPPQTEIPDHVAPAELPDHLDWAARGAMRSDRPDAIQMAQLDQLEKAYRRAAYDTGLTPRTLSQAEKKIAVQLARDGFTADDVYKLVKAKLDKNAGYRFSFLGQDLPDARNAAARVAPPPPVVVAPAAPAVIDIRSAEERARLIREARAALDEKDIV